MTSRTTGITLSVLVALGIAGAGYQVSRLERQRTADGEAARAFDRLTGRAETSVVEVRAAQQAYVAAGQGIDFWITRTGELVEALNRDLIELKQMARSRYTTTSLGAAAQVLDNFVEMDKRVREFARSGEVTTASDMIFTDGLEMTAAITHSLETAREQERSVREPALLAARRLEAYTAGGVAAGVLLLFLLVALSRPKAGEPQIDRPFALEASDAESDLRARTMHAIPPAALPAEPPPDLPAASALCTDLARVTTAAELPALLQRCAALLEASGLVVWLADGSGGELRPALWHGYGPQALSRIPAIPRDADNATAAAFRDQKIVTVPGRGTAAGAIIAPLVGPGGCAGVLTAEIPKGAEARPALLALAGIVAAQLSSLVVTAPAAEPAPLSHPAAAAQ